MTRLLPALVMIAATIVAGASPARAETAECYDDWSIAAPIVRKEGLTTVEDLSRLAKGRIEGSIIKAVLCTGTEGYTYRLVVRMRGGQTKMLIIDAKTPFPDQER